MNRNFDAKSEEGIFLGYSIRRKAYNFLNTNTKKVVESANVNFDEYTKVHEAKPMKEPKESKYFVYFYQDMPANDGVMKQVVDYQKQV